ncbi:MAG: lipoate--protein ligase [Clostridia bacterium]|nr:lipoate--protein ligase [Clostridia bacterium]
MKIILNENTSLSFNMAAEEYLMKHSNDDVFMLWRAARSILIGKNQNTMKEINYDYVKEHNIDVVRRLSGGGTVFCDLGNTNFAFIVTDNQAFSDFRKFTTPILEVLRNLGVNAEFSGRNDLTIDGLKFSGNAQYKYKDRLLHHGTLLFSSDIGDLAKALNPDQLKLKSKGVDSVKSRVTNISAHLQEEIDILEFRKKINEHIKTNNPEAEFYEFTEEDIHEIKKIEAERFNTWDWNFASSPAFDGSRMEKFPGGIVELNYTVKNGKIHAIKFYGDFFSKKEIEDVEKEIIGTLHTEDAIQSFFENITLDDYFKSITADELTSLFF